MDFGQMDYDEYVSWSSSCCQDQIIFVLWRDQASCFVVKQLQLLSRLPLEHFSFHILENNFLPLICLMESCLITILHSNLVLVLFSFSFMTLRFFLGAFMRTVLFLEVFSVLSFGLMIKYMEKILEKCREQLNLTEVFTF